MTHLKYYQLERIKNVAEDSEHAGSARSKGKGWEFSTSLLLVLTERLLKKFTEECDSIVKNKMLAQVKKLQKQKNIHYSIDVVLADY